MQCACFSDNNRDGKTRREDNEETFCDANNRNNDEKMGLLG
jgi:hypothetical protein